MQANEGKQQPRRGQKKKDSESAEVTPVNLPKRNPAEASPVKLPKRNKVNTPSSTPSKEDLNKLAKSVCLYLYNAKHPGIALYISEKESEPSHDGGIWAVCKMVRNKTIQEDENLKDCSLLFNGKLRETDHSDSYQCHPNSTFFRSVLVQIFDDMDGPVPDETRLNTIHKLCQVSHSSRSLT